MSDQVCYPTSHLPFYILSIVLVSFIFFMIFWQSKNQYDYHIALNQTDHNTQIMQPSTPTVTIGSHYSSHSSAVTASPFINPFKIKN